MGWKDVYGSRRQDLIGVLTPLREAAFFNRVYVDCGAVAWPGDIDLAPDAMYREIASQYDERRAPEPVVR
jgi:hypothetical protein